MKKPLINHSWHSMLNGDPSAKVFVEGKIEQLKEVTQKIEQTEGKKAAMNVLDDGKIVYALEKMGEYLDGSNSMNEDDFYIYYDYASAQAKESERIIDKELSHLGL